MPFGGNRHYYSGVITYAMLIPPLNRARTSQNPHWKEEQRAEQRKYPMHCNAHEPERQREQPHNRIQDQGQQSQRPAQHQQDAPKKKSSHDSPLPGHPFFTLRRNSSKCFFRSVTREPQAP